MSQRLSREHVAARTGAKDTHKGRKMLSSKEIDQVAGVGSIGKGRGGGEALTRTEQLPSPPLKQRIGVGLGYQTEKGRREQLEAGWGEQKMRTTE